MIKLLVKIVVHFFFYFESKTCHFVCFCLAIIYIFCLFLGIWKGHLLLHLTFVFFSVIPPWSNLWLVGSIIITMILHVLILYVHPLSVLFSVSFFLDLSCDWQFLLSLLMQMNLSNGPLIFCAVGNTIILGWVDCCAIPFISSMWFIF